MAKAKFNGPQHQELRKFLAKTKSTLCVWQYKVSSQTLIEARFMNSSIVIFALYEPDGWDVWLPSKKAKTEECFTEICEALGLDQVFNGIPRTG
mgnify:CR=1 FL=1